jgi:hypothetical protein
MRPSEGNRVRDRGIATLHVGDVDAFGAQQSAQRSAGDPVIIDDQDPHRLGGAETRGAGSHIATMPARRHWPHR